MTASQTVPQTSVSPIALSGRGEHLDSLVRCFSAAVENLCVVNTICGRRPSEPDAFLRAGAGYQEPWTRDAAINSWQGASIVSPRVARDTMLMVCEVRDGVTLLAQDNQWWDQIIWVVAAWRHFLITGDRDFLHEAYGIGVRSVQILHDDRYAHSWGLYQGPAVMQDGISGFPDSVRSSELLGEAGSLDHPKAHGIMCLSTNLIYLEAYSSLAAMATELNIDEPNYATRHDALASAIEKALWSPEAQSYGYFVMPREDDDGVVSLGLDLHQEALGLAFAVLFDAAQPDRAHQIVRTAHREPKGIVNVWPHMQDFDATHPGRHNVLCWPMVMGYWAQAAAHIGALDEFTTDLMQLVDLVAGSDYHFFETYHAETGAADGGWQAGHSWQSEPDQTWSATALIGVVLTGLFGLEFLPAGLHFRPTVPPRYAPVTVSNLRYRDCVLGIELLGSGSAVVEVRIDGRHIDPTATVHIPADLVGQHQVTVRCAPSPSRVPLVGS
jgi:hypothetical protein